MTEEVFNATPATRWSACFPAGKVTRNLSLKHYGQTDGLKPVLTAIFQAQDLEFAKPVCGCIVHKCRLIARTLFRKAQTWKIGFGYIFTVQTLI